MTNCHLMLQILVLLTFSCIASQALKPPTQWSEWGAWGTWSACAGDCGISKGTQQRARKCEITFSLQSVTMKAECVGDDTENRLCTPERCAVWASWGSWQRCTTERQRACVIEGTNTPATECPGQADEKKFCDDCKGDWSGWGSWGSCVSHSPCGDGEKKRSRTCLPSNFYKCDGPSFETMKCKHQCTTVWTSWSAWGGCSVTCGSGTRSRGRKCVASGTSIIVTGCPGSSTDTTSCNLQGCPVWGPHGPWGPCKGPCGGTGSRSRTQVCVIEGTTTPTTGCIGSPHTQTQSCLVIGCPIWSAWGSFGPCSATCGKASRMRSRRCILAGSNTAASGCKGQASKIMNCLTKLCGRPPCTYNCVPTDREHRVCANDSVRGRTTYRNECVFKRARKCQYPGITIAHFGQCRTIVSGGGGGGGRGISIH